MPATLRGIYHNLKESKYTISNSEVVFFFSSTVYLNKFMEGYKENREKYAKRLEFMNTPFNTDTLADIELYRKTEKRGFFVRINRAKVTTDDLYKYAMRKMSVKETLDWVDTSGK